MPEYLLFLHERTTDRSSMSPEDIQAVIREYQAWSQKMGAAGKLVGGQKLTDDDGRVLAGSGASLSVTDGPLAEAKEVIGGFFHIEADSYDDAVELASDCPHLKYGGRIALRQVDQIE